MFGTSFSEISLIAFVALVVVGPKKLPGMLRTVGQWVGKLRRLTTQMRAQTGIDDILREEGIDGVHELRSLLRGEIAAAKRGMHVPPSASQQAYEDTSPPEPALEYPVDGVDSDDAITEDLLPEPVPEVAAEPLASPAASQSPSEPAVPRAEPRP